MTYVLAECDISFPKYFSMLNTNLASVSCYHVWFNRYFQLKLLMYNYLIIFFKSEIFVSSTQVISMRFLTQFANIVLL